MGCGFSDSVLICYISFRDFTNGYLVAEIFSWYYPQEIQMHMYNNGQSLESKQKNWDLLINVSVRIFIS